MISICIPVYNYDLTSLVNCLHSAIEDSEVYSEIIIGSDGCDASFVESYEMLTALKKVRLHRSQNNIGRAAIRNEITGASKGSYLLYIDADALVVSDARDYLDRYIQYLNSSPVICGGVKYRETEPDDPDKYLRWRYGHYRETKTAKTRNKKPYASFSGFNFLMDRSVAEKIKFNEEFVKYGHEDTLFGFQLLNAGIPVLHIDNSLIHDGLEPNRIFLQKTREGISNLSKLYDLVANKKHLGHLVRLVRVYRHIKIVGLDRLLCNIYLKRKRRFEIVVRSRKTKLRMFDLYKLSLFCYHRLKKPVD